MDVGKRVTRKNVLCVGDQHELQHKLSLHILHREPTIKIHSRNLGCYLHLPFFGCKFVNYHVIRVIGVKWCHWNCCNMSWKHGWSMTSLHVDVVPSAIHGQSIVFIPTLQPRNILDVGEIVCLDCHDCHEAQWARWGITTCNLDL